jgi:hypothetical protein
VIPPRLTVEMVPSTSWGASLAKALRGKRWDIVRRETYRRAGYRCEVCGGIGPRHPVEAHEIWTYDADAGTQRLTVMVALCPACHNVKHIGQAFNLGYGDVALAHLAAVNGWTPDDANAYVDAAFEQWAERSAREWTLDLAALAAYGIEPPSEAELQAGRDLAARIIEAEGAR